MTQNQPKPQQPVLQIATTDPNIYKERSKIINGKYNNEKEDQNEKTKPT